MEALCPYVPCRSQSGGRNLEIGKAETMNSGQGTIGGVLGDGRRALSEEVPVGYKRTEFGLLPNAWYAVLLGDLFVFKNGLNKAKQFFGSGTPIVNYMDVFERPGIRMNDLSGRVNLSPEEIKNFEVRLGDVFFTRTSETVEEIGVASVMLDEPCDTVFSGFVLRARPRNDRLDDRYKQYCFGPRVVRSQIISNATYTTRALTNGRSLSAVWIAVPPKPEQRAIAEALSDVDGLLAALETLIAKKRAIKQAAMQQLLTGKSRLPGFQGEWTELNMARDSMLKARIGWQGLTTAEYLTSGDYYLVTGTDFVRGRVDWTSCFFVDHSRFIQDTNIQLAPYDVLLTKDGTIGKAGFIDSLPRPATLNSGIFVIRPKTDAYVPKYMYYVLTSRIFDDFLARLQAGSTISHLYQKDFVGFTFKAPQVNEQRAIAAVLSDMDAEIATLERRRDKTRAVKQGMMQQLLTGRVRLVQSEALRKRIGSATAQETT